MGDEHASRGTAAQVVVAVVGPVTIVGVVAELANESPTPSTGSHPPRHRVPVSGHTGR
jgi:hypothetical protein